MTRKKSASQPMIFQSSNYSCVSCCWENSLRYLFSKRDIHPLAIKYIYVYSLDSVNKKSNAMTGKGTTSEAVVYLCFLLEESFNSGAFNLSIDYLCCEGVTKKAMLRVLKKGGVALTSIRYGKSSYHYILLIDAYEIDGHLWFYFFDSTISRMSDVRSPLVQTLETDMRSANLRVREDHLFSLRDEHYTLGVEEDRELVLVSKGSK